MLMSAAEPLAATRVRPHEPAPFYQERCASGPRPRRSNRCGPFMHPLASEDAGWQATAGSEFRTSSMRVVPCSLTSSPTVHSDGDEAFNIGCADYGAG